MSGSIGETDSVTFDETSVNTSPNLIDPYATYSDPDITNYNNHFLRVTGLLATDSVGIDDGGGITVAGNSYSEAISFNGTQIGTSYGGLNGQSLSIIFNSAATQLEVQQVLDNLTYASSSDNPVASHNLHIGLDTNYNSPGMTLATGHSGASAEFGNVDGVGGADDLAVGASDGTVYIYLNTATDGSESFSTTPSQQVFISGVTGQTHAAFIDLGNPHGDDLVIGDSSGHLHDFANDGNLLFDDKGSPNPFSDISVSGAASPVFVDFDGDGDQDLIVSGSSSGSLHYYQNDGGVFTDHTASSGLSTIYAPNGDFAVGDIDGDGDIDLVTGSFYSTAVQYYENVNGTFVSESGTGSNPFAGMSVPTGSSLALHDVNGDGKLDLVVSLSNGTIETFLNGEAAGADVAINITPENDAPYIQGLAGSANFLENAVNAAPALLDADVRVTDPEGNWSGGAVSVSGLLAEDSVTLLDAGAGAGQIGFDTSSGTVTYGGVQIGTASGGDGSTFTVSLNGNATGAAVQALVDDLAYSDSSDNPTASRTLHVGVADGDGASNSFEAHYANPSGVSGTYLQTYSAQRFTVDAHDFNGDGKADLLLNNGSGFEIVDNTGTASAPVFDTSHAQSLFLEPGASGYQEAFDAVVGDIDGDGQLDYLVSSADYSFSTYSFGPGHISVYHNNGGILQPAIGPSVSGDASAMSGHMALGDLNGDGSLDLVVSASDGAVHYFTNDGMGNFTEVADDANPFAGITGDNSDLGADAGMPVALTDVNGDGLLDLVFSTSAGIEVALNTGTASTPAFTVESGASNPFAGLGGDGSTDLAFGDLNGDGVSDLMYSNGYGGLKTVLADPHETGDITVGVTAQNDAPLYLHGGVSQHVLVESGNDGAGLSYTSASALAFADPDNGDSIHYDLTGWTEIGATDKYTRTGVYGTVTLNTGTGQVNYQLDNTDIRTDALKSGQVVTDTFTVHVFDSHGASVSHDLVFTIDGDNDPVAGTSGADNLVGTAFNDVLVGIGGDDTLSGGAGNDSLDGGSGNDMLSGGQGDDSMDGGTGVNTVTYAQATQVMHIDLAAGTATGEGADVLVGIDAVIGSAYRDFITGNADANHLIGGGSADQLDGGAGADTLEGGNGADSLDGGTGADSMVGGGGNDTYFVDSAGDVVVETPSAGTDLVVASISYGLTANVENLVLSGSGDIDGTGNELANRITGNSGNNVLEGGLGNDTLVGGGGSDTASYASASTGVNVDLNITVGQDTGGAGTDTLVKIINLTGSAHNDMLTGDGRNNVLSGGDGNDTLTGGHGADHLTGGDGADVFVFTNITDSANKTPDLITDLTNADSIDLTQIDANTNLAGHQAFTLVDHFDRHAGEIVLTYDAGNNMTVLQGDVDGNGRADFTIDIAGQHTDFTNFVS